MSLNNFFDFFPGIYRAVSNYLKQNKKMPETQKTLNTNGVKGFNAIYAINK